MTGLRDRYYGTLVGVLAGDALGAPYETWGAEKIKEDFAARGGLVPFPYDDPWGKDGRFPAGRPTDDSEMTAALGQSLCHTNAEESDLYDRFRRCAIGRRSLLCTLPAYGFGGTTRRALAAATYAEAQKEPQTRPPIPSNGSLMRTAPVALRHHGNFEALVDTARRASAITHTHPLAVECTVFYTVVLDRLLAGYRIENAVTIARCSLKQVIKETELIEYLEGGHRLVSRVFAKPSEPDPKTRGGALVTLEVALWAAARANTFREGIEMAVGMGGDTDTYAAVAGGLLGAIHGADSIPPEWTYLLQGYETMENIAKKLLQVRTDEYGR